MKDFVVHGYVVSPSAVLIAMVYRENRNRNRWMGEVAADHNGDSPLTLTVNGGHLTAEDAFRWAKSELDRIEALKKAHYEVNKP